MQVLSVGDVTQYLKDLFTLDPILGDVWVRGEVSNLSRSNSGHLYWTLKDGTAQLKCIMFRREALFQAVLPENGVELLAHGRVDVYEATGAYQLYVDLLERQGVGALYAQFEALKLRLEAEGLFATERKRPLPDRPTCIGLVTSPSGAVLHDVVSVLRRRWPWAELVLAPAMVQGRDAVPALCQALDQLEQLPDVQIIIIARGGGSLEDLWCFNEEALARRVAACRVPTVSAVGHQTDYTICDFVADLRAPTPSAAAELIAPNVADDRQALQTLQARIVEQTQARVAEQRADLAALRHRLTVHAPVAAIRRARQHLDDLDGALQYRIDQHHAAETRRLDSLRRQLALLDPYGTLQRGYAIVRRADSRAIVTAPGQVTAGDLLDVQLAGGQIAARVETDEKASAPGSSAAEP